MVTTDVALTSYKSGKFSNNHNLQNPFVGAARSDDILLTKSLRGGGTTSESSDSSTGNNKNHKTA